MCRYDRFQYQVLCMEIVFYAHMSTMPICAYLSIVLINFTAGLSEVWQVLHAKNPEQGEIHVTGLVRQVQLARGQAGAG